MDSVTALPSVINPMMFTVLYFSNTRRKGKNESGKMTLLLLEWKLICLFLIWIYHDQSVSKDIELVMMLL